MPLFRQDFLSSIKQPTAELWHPHAMLLFFDIIIGRIDLEPLLKMLVKTQKW